jgi:hypothetical protein
LNVFGDLNLELALKVSRTTRSLGFGERDVYSSTNVTKVDKVSIKHNTQILLRAVRGWLLKHFPSRKLYGEKKTVESN